jgi:hypothetical protein
MKSWRGVLAAVSPIVLGSFSVCWAESQSKQPPAGPTSIRPHRGVIRLASGEFRKFAAIFSERTVSQTGPFETRERLTDELVFWVRNVQGGSGRSEVRLKLAKVLRLEFRKREAPDGAELEVIVTPLEGKTETFSSYGAGFHVEFADSVASVHFGTPDLYGLTISFENRP